MNLNSIDFKALTKKYKDGSATEEEIKYIESELEKNKVINELLADEIENNLRFDSNDFGIHDSDSYAFSSLDQNAIIKKSVNKKIRKIIGFSVVIVLLILLSLKYVISPIMDTLYYNPKAITQAEYHNDFYFDLRTFTELNLPGYALNNVMVDPIGFGKYELYITQSNLFKNTPEESKLKQIRDHRIGTFEDFFKRDYFILLRYSDDKSDANEFNKINFEKQFNDLKKIVKTSYVSAFLEFNSTLSIEDFLNLSQKYKDNLEFKWVAIKVSDEMNNVSHKVGFNPNFNDGSTTSDTPDKEIYPYLAMIDIIDDFPETSSIDTYENLMINGFESHFKSLLKYMYDRQDFVNVFDYNSNQLHFYKSALDYVEKNGVNAYGLLVYADVENMLNFIEKEDIFSLEIDDVKASKYSK